MNPKIKDYIWGTNWLTRQERLVLCTVIALLLVGWAVKSYQIGHPPKAPMEQVKD